MEPTLPTAEEKRRFLEYIKSGDDRATAAWRINPDYTGTMFKKLVNPRSKYYDKDFHGAYDDACRERGPLDPNRFQIWGEERDSSPTTRAGFTKSTHLTHEQLEHFLELVRDGTPAAAATRKLDPPTSMSQINRRTSKDPEFARLFREALEEGFPAYQDELRAEAHRQAFAGDYRALKDQMLMHLPEARALMTNRHEVGLDANAMRLLVERNFSELPPEMLDELIRTLEVKELGPGESTG